MVTFVWQRQFLFSLNHHLSVYVWYFRSLFCGTARSRHQIGANGHPCLSPSLWQTEGGRWGPMPLITSRRFDIWVTAWQTVNRSASLCISFFFVSVSLSLVCCCDVYFSVFLPIHVYLTCPLIRAAFIFISVIHSQSFFSGSLSLSICFHLPSQDLKWFTHLSHSTWFTVIWSSLTQSHNLSKWCQTTSSLSVPEVKFTPVLYRRPPVASYLTLP